MERTPRKIGKSWSKAEVEHLRWLAEKDTPVHIIGAILRRSTDGIGAKARQKGISLQPNVSTTDAMKKKKK